MKNDDTFLTRKRICQVWLLASLVCWMWSAVRRNSPRPCEVKGQVFERDLTLPHTDWPLTPDTVFTLPYDTRLLLGLAVHWVSVVIYVTFTGFEWHAHISLMLQDHASVFGKFQLQLIIFFKCTLYSFRSLDVFFHVFLAAISVDPFPYGMKIN